MENTKIKLSKSNIHLHKIELNDNGDYIAVSSDDDAIFDRFVTGYHHIVHAADEIPKKIEEIEKKYKGKEDFTASMDKAVQISKINIGFSEDAFKTVDGIFGEGTLKKYFIDVYKEIPDFLPSADCLLEFFENIIPVMENLFNRKVDDMRKRSKERMAKYKPQDHKKPGGK